LAFAFDLSSRSSNRRNDDGAKKKRSYCWSDQDETSVFDLNERPVVNVGAMLAQANILDKCARVTRHEPISRQDIVQRIFGDRETVGRSGESLPLIHYLHEHGISAEPLGDPQACVRRRVGDDVERVALV
jgi:hypothetical protein